MMESLQVSTMLLQTRRLALVFATVFILAGCSGEPSESEMRDAVMVASGVGEDGSIFSEKHFAKFKKLQCKEAEKGGYSCDYIGPFGPLNARFVETDDGWRFIPGW